MLNNFFPENRVVYENVEKYCAAGLASEENINAAQKGYDLSCRETDKSRHTLINYLTLTAFPRQQWLRERATLGYTYLVANRVSYFSTNRI
jgi:hypothetical protein